MRRVGTFCYRLDTFGFLHPPPRYTGGFFIGFAMNTLLLDRTTWDLVLDAQGNLAVASEGYAIGQDIASAVRTWSGEQYYNTSLGVPYQGQILGPAQSTALFVTQSEAAALTVPGVADARTYITALSATRQLSGVIAFEASDGTVSSVQF